jgi:hypothetical protein
MEMAFRSKAQTGALLILALSASSFAAEPVAFEVRHRHLRHGAVGTLRVTDDRLTFEERGKHKAHSRQWRFGNIRQLMLSPEVLRILTYEESQLKFGHDLEFVFDKVPEDLAAKLYPVFSRKLDQRFVAAVADNQVKALWEVPVKLVRWTGGSQGSIVVGADHVVYQTESPEQSRTWRTKDIDMVSSSGPFELTITTFELAGSNYAGHKDFHFALKRPLAEAEYDSLWRKVNQAKGLQILNSSIPEGEHQ